MCSLEVKLLENSPAGTFQNKKKKKEILFWNQIYEECLFFVMNSTKSQLLASFYSRKQPVWYWFFQGVWPLLCLQRVIRAGASREPERRQIWPLTFCFRPVCMTPKSTVTSTNNFQPLPSSLVTCHCGWGIHLLPCCSFLGQKDCILSYDYWDLPLWPVFISTQCTYWDADLKLHTSWFTSAKEGMLLSHIYLFLYHVVFCCFILFCFLES